MFIDVKGRRTELRAVDPRVPEEGVPAGSPDPRPFSRVLEVCGGFRPGALFAIADLPGTGRTHLACRLAVAAAERGAAVVFAGSDAGPDADALLLSAESGVSPYMIAPGMLRGASRAAVEAAAGRIAGLGIRSLRIPVCAGSDELCSVAARIADALREQPCGRREVAAGPCPVLVLDADLLPGSRSALFLKDLAKGSGIAIVATAIAEPVAGGDRRAVPLDFGSTGIAADAVFALSSHNGVHYGQRVQHDALCIAKNRFGPSGCVVAVDRGIVRADGAGKGDPDAR